MEEKTCRVCHKAKATTKFRKTKSNKTGTNSLCVECDNKQRRAYAKLHPEVHRKYVLKSSFNLTPEDYDELSQGQGNVCAICENINRNGEHLAVDHDHNTGEIRGLLCSNCNTALGLAHDNPVILRKMADYLDGV